MAKIRVLDERLINKIAAGEVVERPASALKEIMENALDAGATELRVELEAGGKRLIRVIDNGEGMDADDLLLALERHATSKIRDFDDLEEVASLGFRGEAIPSIAAVSRMTIRSRRADRSEGNEAIVEGGVIRSVKPTPMAPGTTVEIRGLFYNVPARRKFLRTTPTEFAHCQNVVSHYALGFPEVNIRMLHNGRELITAPPTESVRDRIAMLMGENLLEHIVPFEGRDEDYSILGFISEPSFTRADTSMLHFFVNRRVVRDKLMIHAVRSSFEDLLPKGRTPVAFLFLEIPPREVDVNVHPSKTEVRFRLSNRVHSLINRSIRAALSGSQPLTTMAPAEQRKARIYRLHRDDGERTEASGSSNFQLRPDHQEKSFRINFSEMATTEEERKQRLEAEIGAPSETAPPQTSDSPVARFAKPGLDGRFARPSSFALSQLDGDSVVPLGQIKNSYIVATFPGGLLLIDQHAAHERVLFEQLQRAATGTPNTQYLLHPAVIDLPPARARRADRPA